MQYYYGEKNVLRALDETEFWKRQETEHTEVIRAVTPALEAEYTAKLAALETEFAETDAKTARFIESAIRSKGELNERQLADMTRWVAHCVKQSGDFANCLSDMLRHSAALEENDAAKTVVNHILREAQYYIGIGELISQ